MFLSCSSFLETFYEEYAEMFNEKEHFFICPYCMEKISMLLDISSSNQGYVEDCEVCCQGIKIHYKSGIEEIQNFTALRQDDV